MTDGRAGAAIVASAKVDSLCASGRYAQAAAASASAKRWSIWGAAASVGLVVVYILIVVVRDPHDRGSWAVCPTWTLLGVACPGCGSLRALHDLGHGHWQEAMGHNLLVGPGIAFVVWSLHRTPGPRWARIWLGALVVFTALRNLPGSPLAP
jgi:hypothetical protein